MQSKRRPLTIVEETLNGEQRSLRVVAERELKVR
jgi:hypothetical protein